MVKGNLGKIGNMTLDLLNYSKERVPEYRRCDLNQPVREVFDLMFREAQRRGVILEKSLDKRLSDGWLEPEGIHRCILNLVSNAIDACTDISCVHGKGHVMVKALKTDGWAVEYQVIDNGCGMDQETEMKIFEQFFSTKGSRGTGLGLMITKKIIDEHRGFIECESEKGKGTTFIVRLPEKENLPEAGVC
jgi:signal transduction histidine kinase